MGVLVVWLATGCAGGTSTRPCRSQPDARGHRDPRVRLRRRHQGQRPERALAVEVRGEPRSRPHHDPRRRQRRRRRIDHGGPRRLDRSRAGTAHVRRVVDVVPPLTTAPVLKDARRRLGRGSQRSRVVGDVRVAADVRRVPVPGLGRRRRRPAAAAPVALTERPTRPAPRPAPAARASAPRSAARGATPGAPRPRPRAGIAPRPAPGRRDRRTASGARATGTRSSPASRTSDSPASRAWISASERAARGPPRSHTSTPSSRPSRSASHSLRGPPVARTTTSGR